MGKERNEEKTLSVSQTKVYALGGIAPPSVVPGILVAERKASRIGLIHLEMSRLTTGTSKSKDIKIIL